MAGKVAQTSVCAVLVLGEVDTAQIQNFLPQESPKIENKMADLKQTALQIFRDTLGAIDIPATFRRKLPREGSVLHVNGSTVDLSTYENIRAVALGKASVAMSRGLEELLAPDFRAEGIVVTPTPSNIVPSGFRTILAGHPCSERRQLRSRARNFGIAGDD